MPILSFNQFKNSSPIEHFVLTIVAFVFVILSALLFNYSSETKWIFIFILIILFAWINPIIGVFTKNWANYTLKSTGLLLLIAAIAFAVELYVFNENMFNSFTNSMLLSVSGVFYLVAIGMCGLFRTVVNVVNSSAS